MVWEVRGAPTATYIPVLIYQYHLSNYLSNIIYQAHLSILTGDLHPAAYLSTLTIEIHSKKQFRCANGREGTSARYWKRLCTLHSVVTSLPGGLTPRPATSSPRPVPSSRRAWCRVDDRQAPHALLPFLSHDVSLPHSIDSRLKTKIYKDKKRSAPAISASRAAAIFVT